MRGVIRPRHPLLKLTRNKANKRVFHLPELQAYRNYNKSHPQHLGMLHSWDKYHHFLAMPFHFPQTILYSNGDI